MTEPVTVGRRPLYPFSALIGQERMKLALLLIAVDPGIGGVLIRGEKGTAKSTAARALARFMPEIAVHTGCAFACDPRRPDEWCLDCRMLREPKPVYYCSTPLVTLPLNATEDMVAGGLDFSATMSGGTRTFQPGLLARAHRGILYIDEVNLLDDHLVDIILDAAESGVNIVEREGLSLCHAARFAIVASMNPEEGALRPQLLDRFGLCVEVCSESDPAVRVEIMERREAFESDPDGFHRAFTEEESALSGKVLRARKLLPAIRPALHLRRYISELTMNQHVAGLRADLVIARTAVARAALAGRETVDVKDVLEAAELALFHRRRDTLPSPPPFQGQDNKEHPDEMPLDQPSGNSKNKPMDEARPGRRTEDNANGGVSSLSELRLPCPRIGGNEQGREESEDGAAGKDIRFDI
ncbi:MAG: ATP-binding protein, partial [Desulfobacteraceae bacterium]|nr:ATP-binding protein [Desulfobacteraceae bacterium]